MTQNDYLVNYKYSRLLNERQKGQQQCFLPFLRCFLASGCMSWLFDECDECDGNDEKDKKLEDKHGLSDQQFKELKLAFRSFDQNNDGYIDIEEVTLLMNQIGANLTADEVKDIMKDGQKNNKLSLSDFIQVMTSTKEDNIDSGTKIGILESEIQQAFDQLDKNDDGYISQEELKILSKQVLGLHFNDDDILRMMEEADLNGDGLVDYQEFKTAIFKQKEN